MMMAWKHQELPFDIANQRVIMEDRKLHDLKTNRVRLETFLKSAASGQFYNPMEAVGRTATIELASESFGEDSVLAALAREVRELKEVVAQQPRTSRPRRNANASPKEMLAPLAFKRDLQQFANEAGIPRHVWQDILAMKLPVHVRHAAWGWGLQEWKAYIVTRAKDLMDVDQHGGVSAITNDEVAVLNDESFISKVEALLPPQPWPKGIHKAVATTLDAPIRRVTRAIVELIRRGRFLPQIDGTVYKPEREFDATS